MIADIISLSRRRDIRYMLWRREVVDKEVCRLPYLQPPVSNSPSEDDNILLHVIGRHRSSASSER